MKTNDEIGASMEPLRKLAEDGWIQEGHLLYRLTDERTPKNRDEINVLMADGSRTEEARTRRAGELLDAIRAAAQQAVQAAVPEHALEPVASMLTFVNGKPAKCGCRFSYSDGGGEYSDVGTVTLCAKHAGTERNGIERAEPFMWAIQEPGGSAYMDENCVSTSRGIVEAEVDGLNLGLGADDEPYKVVPIYLAATQPAAQGMEKDAARYRWLRATTNTVTNSDGGRIDVRNQPDSWDAAIDAALAAQAKQGGAA